MPDIVTDLSASPATASHTLRSTVADARDGYEEWRAWRLRSVAEPTGNLALIETRWLEPGDETTPEQALAGQPETVTATELSRRDLDTGEPQRGIRLWDAASPAIQAYETIEAFPFDPAWVIEATFTPVEGDRTIPFEHIRDNGLTRDLVVPGDITFTRDGVDYTLSAFDDDGTLLLVFGDPTNGAEGEDGTYASGRFLFVRRDGDRAVLDFNRAFVPPCGFSDQYNCPLPPRNNRFGVPVRAGEKRVVLRGGAAH
ncbi:DUF1684 domain-containing protein [Leifsonia sp. F6_8S_P_1B]|uniref:DUF1684 domain-containing protein n=1 Tax=Leifsonia williamsii TaxID=3035919 RepID=A0ABT8KAH6_9MICO|nr:DUF1684 domain-containing protein [Leifsonia williamsii]MDN4614466.1 DUF1684 domain-containing protein [Leifsonia williamsii]